MHAHGEGGTLARLLLATAGASILAAAVRSPFSPTTPKRLIVHHISRDLDGMPLDAGLWISAFDSAGLRELRDLGHDLGRDLGRDLGPSLSLTGGPSRKAAGCDLDLARGASGCYLSFPYYLPLSGIAGAPDGRAAVYLREFTPSSPTGTPSPIAPPEPPAAERLSLEHRATERVPSNGTAARVRLQLRVSGPAQMALVLPEGRLAGWSLAPGLPPPRRSPFAPAERVVFAFLTSGGRPAGKAAAPRIWDLWIDVLGADPLALAAYAHYPDMTSTPALDELARRLPPELRGDWHWSASTLTRRTLHIPPTKHVKSSTHDGLL